MKQWKWDHDCRLDFSRRKKYHHQVKRFFLTKSFLIIETFPACSIPWNVTRFFSVSTYVSNLRRKCVLIFHSLWSCSSSGSLAQVGRWWSTHVDARFGIIIILTGAQRKEGNVVESLIIRKLGLERMEWGKFQDMKIHVCTYLGNAFGADALLAQLTLMPAIQKHHELGFCTEETEIALDDVIHEIRRQTLQFGTR